MLEGRHEEKSPSPRDKGFWKRVDLASGRQNNCLATAAMAAIKIDTVRDNVGTVISLTFFFIPGGRTVGCTAPTSCRLAPSYWLKDER